MNNKRVFLVLVVSNALDLLGGKSIGEENKSGAKRVFRLPCLKGIFSYFPKFIYYAQDWCQDN